MEIKIEQGKGYINREYWTATFSWPKDANHFCYKGKRDWMPKHTELADILETVLAIEPPKKRKLLRRRFEKALIRGFEAPIEHNGKAEAEAEAEANGETDEDEKKICPASVMSDLYA
jgi:hypothetical protein